MKNLDKLAEKITREIMTVHVGKRPTYCDRIACMKGKWPNEKDMGGRNRTNVLKVILECLEVWDK